jgi:hypothetical protein
MSDEINPMEVAGEAAKKEFTKLVDGMTKAQKEGAAMVVGWLAGNFAKAGYKRLNRFLIRESGLAPAKE